MLAIAMVLEGRSRTEAAQACGMDRQTLRDWVHRYNEEGLSGLSDRKSSGREPKLTPAQMAQLAEWVRTGPDLVEDGVVRWRRIDLARKIEREFAVVVVERTVGKLLRKLGFRRLSVRPVHPEKDPAAEQAHKKTSPIWSPAPYPKPSATGRSRSGGRTKPASASREP